MDIKNIVYYVMLFEVLHNSIYQCYSNVIEVNADDNCVIKSAKKHQTNLLLLMVWGQDIESKPLTRNRNIDTGHVDRIGNHALST